MRFTVSVFVPPWNVGVAPVIGSLAPCWIVRLCDNDALLVNWIETLPAFAVSELLVTSAGR